MQRDARASHPISFSIIFMLDGPRIWFSSSRNAAVVCQRRAQVHTTPPTRALTSSGADRLAFLRGNRALLRERGERGLVLERLHRGPLVTAFYARASDLRVREGGIRRECGGHEMNCVLLRAKFRGNESMRGRPPITLTLVADANRSKFLPRDCLYNFVSM